MVSLRGFVAVALGGLGLALAACGLISSDVTEFTLQLPQKPFQVDTADWNVAGTGNVPSIACSTNQCGTLCSASTGTTTCTGDCNTSTSTCQAHIQFLLINDYDLVNDPPRSYAQVAGQPVVSVTVGTIAFKVTQNTLNVATPPLQIWVAASTATSPSDPSAKLVGTIRSIPSAMSGTFPVDLGPDGSANLKQYMDDYKTPFRIMVTGTRDVHAVDPVPMGQLAGFVDATAHVSL